MHTGLNSAIDALAAAREKDTIGTTALWWEKNLAFLSSPRGWSCVRRTYPDV